MVGTGASEIDIPGVGRSPAGDGVSEGGDPSGTLAACFGDSATSGVAEIFSRSGLSIFFPPGGSFSSCCGDWTASGVAVGPVPSSAGGKLSNCGDLLGLCGDVLGLGESEALVDSVAEDVFGVTPPIAIPGETNGSGVVGSCSGKADGAGSLDRDAAGFRVSGSSLPMNGCEGSTKVSSFGALLGDSTNSGVVDALMASVLVSESLELLPMGAFPGLLSISPTELVGPPGFRCGLEGIGGPSEDSSGSGVEGAVRAVLTVGLLRGGISSMKSTGSNDGDDFTPSKVASGALGRDSGCLMRGDVVGREFSVSVGGASISVASDSELYEDRPGRGARETAGAVESMASSGFVGAVRGRLDAGPSLLLIGGSIEVVARSALASSDGSTGLSSRRRIGRD